MKGIVYLIQPTELIGTSRYKIGCSKSPTIKRIKDYKEGTRCIQIMECDEPMKLEKKLIQKFRENFNLIAGNEYFEGNEYKMKEAFFEIILEDFKSLKIEEFEEVHDRKKEITDRLEYLYNEIHKFISTTHIGNLERWTFGSPSCKQYLDLRNEYLELEKELQSNLYPSS